MPGLEARFGRLGAEFQQLLESSGDTQPGNWQDWDAFFLPASAATAGGGAKAGPASRPATLLEQLQERLAAGTIEARAPDAGSPEADSALQRAPDDASLEFHACPGRLRQLQIVRDRLLQLLAADDSLEPRDILVMTPQVEAFAPLVGAVFGDSEATGVTLPWRLTDRSQQSEAGLGQGLLGLLQLGGERLTATALETLLGCGPLLRHQGIDPAEAGALTALLQRAGFRWGLDGRDRGGDSSHSLGWAIDRLLLGLVLPQEPGLAPGETAPLAMSGSLEQQGRWLGLLRQLQRSLHWLGQARSVADWVTGLRQQLPELFGDGGELAWELQAIQAVLADWNAVAGASPLLLEAPVVAEVLGERLSEGSGRFGHRSGALTISALEPMRAIPHRVVVLMGLDAGAFPRQRQRPGFHLLEQQRRLGDPSSGDQDRYVLLESLLSARQHLLISWSNRDERGATSCRRRPGRPSAATAGCSRPATSWSGTPQRQCRAWPGASPPARGTAPFLSHPRRPGPICWPGSKPPRPAGWRPWGCGLGSGTHRCATWRICALMSASAPPCCAASSMATGCLPQTPSRTPRPTGACLSGGTAVSRPWRPGSWRPDSWNSAGPRCTTAWSCWDRHSAAPSAGRGCRPR